MSIYERRKDGPINAVLQAKLYKLILDFATGDQINATEAEVETFLNYIQKNLHDILFINLNAKKANGKGGSIHVHYAIPARTAKGDYRIRFLHGLVGRSNEYFKEFGTFAFDQLYKQHLYPDLVKQLQELQVIEAL